MNQTTYIYGLESKTDGIRYIGKSDYPEKRLSVHRCKSAYKNPHLHRWISKNNDISLFIIDEVEKSNWQFWERWYIELFKSWNIDLVNISKGGDGCDGYRHSEESKKKMSDNHHDVNGKNNPMYGKVSAMNGKKHKDESKEKIRNSQLGAKNHQYGRKISDKTKSDIRKKLGKKVLLNGVIYDSVRQLCLESGLNRSTYRYRTKNGYIYENGAWVKL